ncbi:MAG TPA: bifunctional phosphopantothenoylcysteine decarboxylase/phosphopantothenate--cysteine ligase CoaBC [Polyangiaceae bacterium]|jgi:phosphopantothenoylcysteine decarboxylase/phosphopantothenate--cysteine ligase|nr:MAG: Coenzyme A biosynthesis bifunctional protein CoaBC [Deltaproteobacteria bacterium ADurb.Bin207]HNS96228.1 bifunctional phosphopantothenoylcysteine decarboxylase/phosphopantothenate--cysteine ligase CoaBC [Polyangiaceae bacterium]HNZ20829.1 bifunctional phosphopantothenoylcysteine decarboxylase/phosphopantothenate--cysteine ligase CoaBC [Polyangiaceae bacterium]HOD22639.1 bifunctional phosphopantothenoylcysteine decarboxylase/phosphopantothenate--cysteine ligase CoaBC [Polyangiaceae bacte
MNQPVTTPHSPTVVLGVTGSIAAFKSIEIARLLIQHHIRVLPVLTQSGARFVGPVTFTGICGEASRMDMWDPSFSGELHVALASQADVVLVAPATADIIARFAQGRADDLLTALTLCARGHVIVAPAMHPRMWAHPATQRNVQTLQRDARIEWVGPVVGPVANGEIGLGRMAEPQNIVSAVLARLRPPDLNDWHIVVTAGPTVEDIDPVRFLGNRSTGRMGFSVARRAAARGARVTLIAGPTELTTPAGVQRRDVRSASDMRSTLHDVLGPSLGGADALVMAAAVGDYRPAHIHNEKMKRGAQPIQLELVANPDILAELGSMRTGSSPLLVGFAVETADEPTLIEHARGKLSKKRVDFIVANSASIGFGGESNEAILVGSDDIERLPRMTKDELADRILDRVIGLRSGRG